MRAFTAVILGLAAIATAAPAAGNNNNNNNAIDAVQITDDPECIYDCACGEEELTTGCCVGGVFDGNFYCNSMGFEAYDTFKECCSQSISCRAPIGCPYKK